MLTNDMKPLRDARRRYARMDRFSAAERARIERAFRVLLDGAGMSPAIGDLLAPRSGSRR